MVEKAPLGFRQYSVNENITSWDAIYLINYDTKSYALTDLTSN